MLTVATRWLRSWILMLTWTCSTELRRSLILLHSCGWSFHAGVHHWSRQKVEAVAALPCNNRKELQVSDMCIAPEPAIVLFNICPVVLLLAWQTQLKLNYSLRVHVNFLAYSSALRPTLLEAYILSNCWPIAFIRLQNDLREFSSRDGWTSGSDSCWALQW